MTFTPEGFKGSSFLGEGSGFLSERGGKWGDPGAGTLVYHHTCSRSHSGKLAWVGTGSEPGRWMGALIAACFR